MKKQASHAQKGRKLKKAEEEEEEKNHLSEDKRK